MKQKIKLFDRHLKIARSDVWWDDSRSVLKVQIGEHLIHFWQKKNGQNLGNFPIPQELSGFYHCLPKLDYMLSESNFQTRLGFLSSKHLWWCYFKNVWRNVYFWLHDGGQLRPFPPGAGCGIKFKIKLKSKIFSHMRSKIKSSWHRAPRLMTQPNLRRSCTTKVTCR